MPGCFCTPGWSWEGRREGANFCAVLSSRWDSCSFSLLSSPSFPLSHPAPGLGISPSALPSRPFSPLNPRASRLVTSSLFLLWVHTGGFMPSRPCDQRRSHPLPSPRTLGPRPAALWVPGAVFSPLVGAGRAGGGLQPAVCSLSFRCLALESRVRGAAWILPRRSALWGDQSRPRRGDALKAEPESERVPAWRGPGIAPVARAPLKGTQRRSRFPRRAIEKPPLLIHPAEQNGVSWLLEFPPHTLFGVSGCASWGEGLVCLWVISIQTLFSPGDLKKTKPNNF